MKYLNKQATVLIICVVAICVLCISTVSYAYFTTQIIGNENAKEMIVETGDVEITYTDSNEVNVNELLPGDTITKTFKVTNTGTLEAKYNIKIDVEINDFEDYSDLTYTLTKDGTQEGLEKVLPYEDGYILTGETLENQNDVHNYTLTIKFKKDNSNQNDNINKKVKFKIEVDNKEGVNLYEYVEPYKDSSGANRPKLYQGLIPITYNEDNTMKIADITSEWYNYDEHKWGNAVLINHEDPAIVNKFYDENGKLRVNETITEEDILQMYVWIPRYKYELFNADNQSVPEQMINISFEKGVTTTGNVSCTTAPNGKETCENAINGNWYTHPAFTFGDTELSGIWVGKFETGNTSNDIKILSNITPIHDQLPNMFQSTRNIETSIKYNLNPSEIDTHLAKNMDWGAMAYLTQSKYGRCKENGECTEVALNSQANKTGYDNSGNLWNTISGGDASTTGNIYGIYDTSGGSWDHVMGNMVDENGNFSLGTTDIEFNPDKKYYDIYEYGTKRAEHGRGHLGDATRETVLIFDNENGGWYSDFMKFPWQVNFWMARGGHYTADDIHAGIFSFHDRGYITGGIGSFRVVLTAQDGEE